MPRGISNVGYAQLYLPPVLEPEVDAWSKQGWTGVTQTSHDLLSYWFNRDGGTQERFYFCQQRAIETVIYCHEVLCIRTLRELYERLAPKALLEHLPLKDEVESIPFPKYSLKMATGTGKTWVLAALLVWQYFNSLSGEHRGWYSKRLHLALDYRPPNELGELVVIQQNEGLPRQVLLAQPAQP